MVARALSSSSQSPILPDDIGTGFGGLILSYLLGYKLMGYDLVADHGPLMVAGALLLLAGLMMFTTGLLGEVLIRVYFESQGRRIYAIRELRTQRRDQVPKA